MRGPSPVPHHVVAVVPVASASGTIGGVVGFLVVLGVVAVLLRNRRR